MFLFQPTCAWAFEIKLPRNIFIIKIILYIIDQDYSIDTYYYFNTTISRKILPRGKNIKKLRKQKGLSQDRLSKLADISYNTVIKLESGGITNPSIDTLQKLTRTLDVSVDNLLKR